MKWEEEPVEESERIREHTINFCHLCREKREDQFRAIQTDSAISFSVLARAYESPWLARLHQLLWSHVDLASRVTQFFLWNCLTVGNCSEYKRCCEYGAVCYSSRSDD